MLRRLSYFTVAALAVLLMATPVPASANIAPGFHQVVNRSSWECLDVLGAYRWAGAEVGVWRCVNEDNQRWSAEPVNSGLQFRVAHTGMCLSVHWKYQGDGNGSTVVQDTCRGGDEETWVLRVGSDGWDQITIWDPYRHNWKCLDKSTGHVIVWGCNGEPWQKWQSMG
jgi:hypothetical protein